VTTEAVVKPALLQIPLNRCIFKQLKSSKPLPVISPQEYILIVAIDVETLRADKWNGPANRIGIGGGRKKNS
jgi:hypothetical protein